MKKGNKIQKLPDLLRNKNKSQQAVMACVESFGHPAGARRNGTATLLS